MSKFNIPKSLTAAFLMDEDLETNGVWIALDGNVRIRIRRFKSEAVRTAMEKFGQPGDAIFKGTKLEEGVSKDIMIRVLAEGVIADWAIYEDLSIEEIDAGVDPKSKPIPATFENKVAFLKELPELADRVFALSMDADLFKAKKIEHAKGN